MSELTLTQLGVLDPVVIGLGSGLTPDMIITDEYEHS